MDIGEEKRISVLKEKFSVSDSNKSLHTQQPIILISFTAVPSF